METQHIKKMNSALTRQVIALHDKGYTADFINTSDRKLICLQNSDSFVQSEVNIRLIDQVFDHLSKTYKYIHAIETPYGERGLLVTESICCFTY